MVARPEDGPPLTDGSNGGADNGTTPGEGLPASRIGAQLHRPHMQGLTNGMAPTMLVKEISMPISPPLLAILACPLCKADVKLTADEKGLKCVSCHRVYPIKDDIPVMIIDEASVEPGRAVKT